MLKRAPARTLLVGLTLVTVVFMTATPPSQSLDARWQSPATRRLVSTQRQLRAHAFGVNAGGLRGYSQTALRERMQGIRHLGATWVRFDIAWSDVQPDGPEKYDWASSDANVHQARRHKLKVLAMLAYTPAWARPQTSSSAKYEPDVKAFSSFAARVATRYGPVGVHHWEVWNEPNIPAFWQPTPDPKYYTRLLKATYKRIKKADYHAVVVAGAFAGTLSDGVSISPVDFLKDMYANGAKRYFDAVSIHPYTYPFAPKSDSPNNLWPQVAELRRVLVAHGDAKKKIWITEYGAPTNGPGVEAITGAPIGAASADHVSEELQAAMLRDSVLLDASVRWTGPFIWYQYKDDGVSPSDKENFFGLVRYDGSQKPAYAVMKRMLYSRRQ